jgi:hypothetical protein
MSSGALPRCARNTSRIIYIRRLLSPELTTTTTGNVVAQWAYHTRRRGALESPRTATRLCGGAPRRAAGPLPWQSWARSAVVGVQSRRAAWNRLDASMSLPWLQESPCCFRCVLGCILRRFSTHHPTKSSSSTCSTTVNPTSVYETTPPIGASGMGKK